MTTWNEHVATQCTPEQLAEAERAADLAMTRFPDLRGGGFVGEGALRTDPWGLVQIATSLAFLRRCTATATPRYSAFELKCVIERSEQYVCNGAVIAAAAFLGLPMRRFHYGALIGVTRRSVQDACREESA